jgi:hypothetical protein
VADWEKQGVLSAKSFGLLVVFVPYYYFSVQKMQVPFDECLHNLSLSGIGLSLHFANCLGALMKILLLWTLVFNVCSAERLIFSQAIFRHGERAPSDPFVNIPFGAETWTLGMGRMTYRGLYHQYELGKWLRNHYVDKQQFLSKEYNYSEVSFAFLSLLLLALHPFQ